MTYNPHSYLTIVQSDDLLAYVIPSSATSAWVAGDVEDGLKTQALYEASYYFDSLSWLGFKEEPEQSYAFPRVGLPGQNDGDSRDELRGSLVDAVGVLPLPVAIALATTAAFIADEYLTNAASPDALLSMGFKTVEIGSMKVEMIGQQQVRAKIPDVAQIYLGAYLRANPNGRGMREFRFI